MSPGAGILIEHLRRDGGTQIRAALDEDTVSEYAEAYRSKASLPPPRAFYDGTDYWLADGFHRVQAAQRAGLKRLLTDVEKGTRRDAILAACGANVAHGLRRSNNDKRRAVETMLADKEWSQWADRRIARQCGVSNTFVSDARGELTRRVSAVDTLTEVKPAKSLKSAQAGQGGRTSQQQPSSAAVHGRSDAGECEGGGEGAGAPGHLLGAHRAPAPDEPLGTEVDLHGLVVSGQQIAEWGRLEDALSAFDSHLRAAQAALADEAKRDVIAAELQALRQAAHDLAARARKSVRPKSVCLYCKDPEGTAGRRVECNGCHGRGWLTEEQLVSVPRELVGGDKVIDQKRGGFVAAVAAARHDAMVNGAGFVQVKDGQARRMLQIQDDAGKELRVELDDDDSGPSWG